MRCVLVFMFFIFYSCTFVGTKTSYGVVILDEFHMHKEFEIETKLVYGKYCDSSFRSNELALNKAIKNALEGNGIKNGIGLLNVEIVQTKSYNLYGGKCWNVRGIPLLITSAK